MTPKGYSRSKILLRWSLAALVALQFLLNERISEAGEKIEDGVEAVTGPLVTQHVLTGILILALVAWRIALKFTRGAPNPPESEHPLLQLAARASHIVMNLLLLAMAVTGGLAWFGGIEALAELHEAGKTLLLLLIGLHVVAVMYHQFVLRTNVMDRMKRPAD